MSSCKIVFSPLITHLPSYLINTGICPLTNTLTIIGYHFPHNYILIACFPSNIILQQPITFADTAIHISHTHLLTNDTTCDSSFFR